MLPLRDHLPTRHFPFVNYGLLLANIAIFLLGIDQLAQGADPEALVLPYALVPAHVLAHPLAAWPTLFSHMFLHGGLGHLGGNMLFLWIFGDNVEDAIGHLRYLVFYLLCGLVGAAAQVALDPHSMVPMLGASGAISGVLAAYALVYPRSPITVVNPIPLLWLAWGVTILFPAWLVIAEFFVANLWDALQTRHAGGGVAFAAHVGGFLGGAAMVQAFLPKRRRSAYPAWEALRRPMPRGR